MVVNPFKVDKSVKDKVIDGIKKPIQESLEFLPHRVTKKEKWFRFLLHLLLYFSIFVSGYMVAKLQTLLNIVK